MSSRLLPMILTVSLGCSACAGGQGGVRRGEWEDIDYSKVYKAAGQRDTDANYKMPTVTNCVDDDLYNCNK